MQILKKFKTHFILLLIIVCLILLTKSKDFINFYGFSIYPLFSNSIAYITGLFPFSLFEIILYSLSLYCIYFLIQMIIHLLKKNYSMIGKKISHLILVFQIIYISFMLLCGLNYHRDSFIEIIDLKDKTSTKENLLLVCQTLLEEIPQMTTSLDNESLLIEECKSAMNQLATIYPCLEGYYPNSKGVLLSKALSYLNITGIFTPWTVEANYNKDITLEEKPFVICHELSHLRGFMQEEEANFIAYLATHHSDNDFIKYSGEIEALNYCLNALYRNGYIDEYKEIYQQLPEYVKSDYQKQYEYWSNYDTIVGDIHDSINDAYLKANDQELGSESYRYFVELLIDYYGE